MIYIHPFVLGWAGRRTKSRINRYGFFLIGRVAFRVRMMVGPIIIARATS